MHSAGQQVTTPPWLSKYFIHVYLVIDNTE